MNVEPLRCPVTAAPLRMVDGNTLARLRAGTAARQFTADEVTGALAAEGSEWIYAVAGETPVLLAPEALSSPGAEREAAAADAAFAGVYRDLEHYRAVASRDEEIEAAVADHGLDGIASGDPGATFPEPPARWLARREGVYDNAAELEAYRFLAPLAAKIVLQTGGRGTHAVKFLLAGAREAWLLTPFLEEARFGLALAERCGVGGRLQAVVATAEQPGLAAGMFDAIYSPGSMHHTELPRALAALIALLRPGGRFASVDPWRAPGYALGTKLLGKREREVGCRPLSGERLAPARRQFPRIAVHQHGALTRYALIALGKAGVNMPRDAVLRITSLDDRLSEPIPGLRGMGSSVCLLYERPNA